MSYIMHNIALKIRKLRLMRDLTQEYLAEQTCIGIRTYRKIETGRSSPTLRQLELIVRTLDCSIIQLLHFNPETYQFEPQWVRELHDYSNKVKTAIQNDREIPYPVKTRLQRLLHEITPGLAPNDNAISSPP